VNDSAKMQRKEQFAFGAALIAATLAVILSKSLAWLILIIGLGFVFDFYVRGLIWGTDRLTREEIENMPAEEYEARVLGNCKTESWVNWLVSGRDAFNKQMRKLARQAVIFMLVTPVLAFAGDFGYLHRDAHKQAVPATMSSDGWIPLNSSGNINSNIPPPPAGYVPVPPGAVIGDSFPFKGGNRYVDQGKLIWTCQNGVRKTPAKDDDWVDVTPDLTPHPQTISQTSPSNTELFGMALPFALFAIPAGFGMWVLYRAILFAVKGSKFQTDPLPQN
jgi:hypothetical protein